MMKRILIALLVPLLLTGCRKDGFLSYTGRETGYIQDGVFTTDEGVKLVVEGNGRNYDIRSGRRVLVGYQITAIGTNGSYTIDLQELLETVTVVPVPASESIGLVTDDPVLVDEAWFSGGYLNMTVSYGGKDASLHSFPMTYETDGKQTVLRLYHDARESVTANTDGLQTCLCYPMAQVATAYAAAMADRPKANTSAIPVLLRWRWYENNDASRPAILFEKEGSFLPSL